MSNVTSRVGLGTFPSSFFRSFVLCPSSSKLAGAALTVSCLVGAIAQPAASQTVNPQANASNPVIAVGIAQRFGDDSTDTITLEPIPGDRLTLRFKTGEQPQTVTTNAPVKVDVQTEALAAPEVVERVVVSTHRSFESAEDSATQWRSRGIEVEVAQPRQWQVWAKRDIYKTPLLRRLLLKNLQAQGSRVAFIDTQMKREIPKLSFTVNGFRYNRDELDILSGNSRIFVTKDDKPSEEPERRLFAGSLRLQTNAYGTYTLVNNVPIETYLRGVVPHEIGLQAPLTTIQAQAILARTYALRNLRRFAIDNYQLCADTQCQVYWGLSGAVEKTDRAILATRGLVLTYQGELIDALYSSTTGGVTAPFSDVWDGPNRPYLQAVVDSVQSVWNLAQRPLSDEANLRAFINMRQGFNEAGWDTFRWRIETPIAQISNDLKEFLSSKQSPLVGFTKILGLEVTQRSPAGRVQQLTIETDKGTVTLEKDEILRALSAPNSTLFYVEPVYQLAEDPKASPSSEAFAGDSNPLDQTELKAGTTESELQFPEPQGSLSQQPPVLKGYAFVGGGLGHAVGMSQTGAYALGRLNWSASRILGFYYPGTQLEPLNSEITLWRDPADNTAQTTER